LSSVELHNYITDSVAWNIWNIKLAHSQAHHVWNLILYAPWSIWVSLLKEVRYSGVRTFGRNSLSIMASVTKHSRSALLTSNLYACVHMHEARFVNTVPNFLNY